MLKEFEKKNPNSRTISEAKLFILPSICCPLNLIWWDTDVGKDRTFACDIFDGEIAADPDAEAGDDEKLATLLRAAGVMIEETEGTTVVFGAKVEVFMVVIFESLGGWYELVLFGEHKVIFVPSDSCIAFGLLSISTRAFVSFPPLLKSNVSP